MLIESYDERGEEKGLQRVEGFVCGKQNLPLHF